MTTRQKLFFRKTGEGKPVVILHGLFGMSDNWQTIAKKLAEQNYCVYTPDLRNHGQSFHDHESSYALMTDDVIGFLSGERIVKPALLGHSMGGKVAMNLALNFPDHISSLIVVDMPPGFMPVHHGKIIEALKGIDLKNVKTRGNAEKFLREKNMDVATSQFLLKNLYWKTPEELAWRFNLPAIEKNIGEIGKALQGNVPYRGPVLFIRGELSTYITDRDRPEILKFFPSAEISSAPGSGHWVHADNPSWLLEKLLEFLQK